jgi:hypothetical protein
MTVSDLRCDVCSVWLSGPVGGPRPAVGFSYHPGDPRLRDDSGTLCRPCWQRWTDALGERTAGTCAQCQAPVRRRTSLHLRRRDEPGAGWQLCSVHAVGLLNELRTVSPKLDPATFRFPLDPATEVEAL